MPKISKLSIKKRKEKFLAAYKKNMGFAAMSCVECSMAYQTFQKWFAEDEQFRLDCLEVDHIQGDYVVSKLMKKIEEGDTASIIFYLKAKLNWKDRQIVHVEGQIDHTMKSISINVVDGETKLLMENAVKLFDTKEIKMIES